MERNDNFIYWFLLRLLLIFILNFRNHLTVQASESKFKEMSFTDESPRNENNINDRMIQIEARSNRQENEIGILKTKASEDRRIINDLEGRVAVLEASSIITTELGRPKRPARLLPVSILYGKQKNNSEEEVERFYGPATSCDELRKLGYTLNGHYLVNSKIPSLNSSSNKIEVIFCKFKKPLGANESDKEKRLGAISIMANHNSESFPISQHLTTMNPQSHSTADKEKRLGEVSTKPANRNSESSLISQQHLTTMKPQSQCIQINHLKRSDQDLCLTTARSKGGQPDIEGLILIQFKCDKDRDEQKWVHYGKHICQIPGAKCLTVSHYPDSTETDVVLSPYDPRDNFQQWSVDVKNGKQVVNDQGYCLAVDEYDMVNSSKKLVVGAKIKGQKCIWQKQGVKWRFTGLSPLATCFPSSALKKSLMK